MKEPSFWDKWEWARAHQKPEPKFAVGNTGAAVAPLATAPLDAPRFSDIKSLDAPIIIDATGSPPEKSWGDTARDLAASTGRDMVKLGSALEDNGYMGEVSGKAYNHTHPRQYIQFIPGGGPIPVPSWGDALTGASQFIGGVGSGMRGLGAGLLSWGTGNNRPLLDAGMSINTGRHAPLLMQPLVDEAFKTGLDRTYRRNQD